jgi:outer membrane protease
MCLKAAEEGRIQMNTCVVHYTFDPRKIKAFEGFTAARIRLVDHHGYFMPSKGASDGALALFSFPSTAADEQYRQRFDVHPASIAAHCIRDENRCVLRYERPFLGADK